MRVLKHTSPVQKLYVSAVAFLVLGIIIAASVFIVSRSTNVEASMSQVGAQRVTLNPGGGRLSDGTDGIRFTINASSGNDGYESTNPGQDALLYRGTYQYCCSAGGPMLNIGGTLYGQAGPAYSSADWSSIQIIATSGVTTVGNRTNNTGNSSAIVRYTVNVGELTYVIDRTMTYTYPNDYVTDNYDFTIPAGNTDQVKFYLGGDTAPGSSDQGYGIMLTEPVRSVISLNTSSQIMFGFREVSGSRPFDGATSQGFYNPYSTVQTGGDIGFIGTPYNHDAGLMMQWNLGSTPGSYTGKFQQFATQQGTNLNAAFSQSRVETGEQAQLNISVVNSELSAQSGLGYTLTLPAGLVIDGVVSTDCNGSLTASIGTDTISASGVSINGASNCVVSVPVVSNIPGSYTVNAASVSGLGGVLTNNVGSSTLNVGVYAISFVTQGGTNVDDIVAEEGDLIVLPTTTRPGNIFIEWNTAVDGSGSAYAPSDEFILPSEDLTLYAIWEPIPYDLTFDTQGGDPIAGQENIFYNQEVGLSLPTRSGYEFVEWNTAANGSGDSYEEGDSYYMAAADTTLYAIWAQLYTLSFNTQGGTAQSAQDYTAGTDVYLPDGSERDGYRLMSWNTAANGSGDEYPADGTFTMPASSITLYAIWAPTYTFTWFVLGEEETEQFISGEDVYLSSDIPRDGYEFIGWNTAMNGSGTTYTYETGFTMPAQAVTLYAIWEDNDGVTIEQENAASPNGDANGDDIPDSQQSHVSSLVSPKTGQPVSLEVLFDTEGDATACSITGVNVQEQSSLAPDSEYDYPLGLLDFAVDCGTPGFSATVTQYFYNPPANSFVLRKFINEAFVTVSDATFSTQTINGQSVLVVSYQVVDGGELDADGEENGIVFDPAGPATVKAAVSAPNTGLAPVSTQAIAAALVFGIGLLAAVGMLRRHRG